MSASPPNVPLMPHAAVPARPEARPDSLSRSCDRALVDTALAVHEADGLDDALAALVHAGRDLLDADRVLVAVWDAGRTEGSVRAAAGIGTPAVGTSITPAESEALCEALSGRPGLARSGSTDAPGSRVVVPVAADGLPTVTFEAGWRDERSDGELLAAADTLDALGALTRIAFREKIGRVCLRKRLELESVLDSVGEAIVVRTADGLVLNRVARNLLELDEEASLEPSPPIDLP